MCKPRIYVTVKTKLAVFYHFELKTLMKILFYHIPQFTYESKSARIIEIGPHLPTLS